MPIALDYIHMIALSDLQSVQATEVFRYLSFANDDPLHKIIGPTEYDALTQGGTTVHLNWEYKALDWQGGASAGTAHGTEAVIMAKILSHPRGRAIIGSADFDATPTDWALHGHAYASAFAAAVRKGGYAPGVYGPWDILEDCKAIMDYFWQAGMSHAWSNGRNATRHPLANWRQMGHMTVGGQDCDWSEIIHGEKGNTDMTLTDKVTGTSSPDYESDRTVDQVLGDLYRLRLVLKGQLTPAAAGYGPETPLAHLLAPIAGTPTGAVSTADIVAAVKEALREGTAS